MRTHSLDARRIAGAELGHPHDMVRHAIGFLLELIARFVDREFRLEQLVVKEILSGLIAEMRLPSERRP